MNRPTPPRPFEHAGGDALTRLLFCAAAALGCQWGGGGPRSSEATTTVVGAVSLADDGLTTANLQLQVSKNACAANLAQTYFQVTNASSAAVPLSQLAIRYWINDTTGTAMTPEVWYGGCVTSPDGTCVHPISGVTATATPFAPGCGTDGGHQANWEITITTTDPTPLAAGQTWSNLQTAVNLASYASFSPGSGTWYSGCGTGQPYAADPHFALYDGGALVNNQGVLVPLCRAPQVAQIQSFIDQTFYATSDIASSFISDQGEAIDCIDFSAQHSVKAWQAAGLTIPGAPPPLPALPSSVPPPAFASSFGYRGQLDVNGRAEQCPAGFVAVSRPTVADVLAAGGIEGYKASNRGSRIMGAPPVGGRQSPDEHDCWLNTAGPGDGEPIGSTNAVDWEHAVGIQSGGWLPSGATGFYGAHLTMPIYQPFVDQATSKATHGDEHADAQFWVQTGDCVNWYNPQADVQSQDETKNQCTVGSSCSGAGAGGASCAVQSLEVAALSEKTGVTNLETFFTTDGYFFANCYSNRGTSCTGCPTLSLPVTPPAAGAPSVEGTDCWVAWPGAITKTHAPLKPRLDASGNQYGVQPLEAEIEVLDGTPAGSPGWWVLVDRNYIGWYPPATFNWPSDNTPGPLSTGPATYLQAGGEVEDSWPNGAHTGTSMVSDNAAKAGFEFAAYTRNVGYYDSGSNLHDATLAYPLAPASEADDGAAGLCGLQSGGWTDASGHQGAYSIATTDVPPGQTGWNTYLYFGGGRLTTETLPPAKLTIGAITAETASFGPDICFSGSGFTPHGAIAIEYDGVPVDGVPPQFPADFPPSADANGQIRFDDDQTFFSIENPNCSNAQFTGRVQILVTDVTTGAKTNLTLPSDAWCASSSVPARIGDTSGCGV